MKKQNISFGQNMILAKKYRLLQKIGTGAHGEVFEAELVEDRKKKVAIKIFYRHLEKQILAFIWKELQVIERLDHPHILKVLAYGNGPCGGELVRYLVTPFMQGRSIAEILEERTTFRIGDAVNVGLQIADALNYMHEHKFIHRDVKPQNILADKALKNFVLADFGIACQADAVQTRIAGTMEYCAPEQMENRQTADVRMDIYGLGMTLYELLVGTNPYRQIAKTQGEAAALKCKYVGEFPLVSEGHANIPYSLALLIKKMTANSPNERHPNMQQVIKDLLPYAIHDQDTPTSRTELPQLPSDLNQIFEEARKARQQKSWHEALFKYTMILQQQPECAQAYYGCGLVYFQLKQYQKAEHNFTLALQYRPNSYSTYCQRSQVYIELKNFDSALADLNHAISISPKRAEGFFYRANIYRLLAKQHLEKNEKDLYLSFSQKMKQDLDQYQLLKNADELQIK